MVRAARQESRHGGGGHQPGELPGRARRRWRTAGSRLSSGGAWRRRPTRTPPPTTRRCRPGSPRPTRRTRSRRETGWPDVTAARVDAPGRAAVRREPAPARRAVPAVRRGTGRAAQAPGSPRAEVLHGKAMSYNNYVDADAARRAAFGFSEPCVAIMKHANPCGIAVGADLAEAHRKAHACDPVSAFGGVIAANGTVTKEMAAQVAEIFTEVIIAPGFEPGRAGDPDREEEPAAAARAAPAPGAAGPPPDRLELAPGQRRHADADPRYRRRAGRLRRELAARRRRSRRRQPAGRPGVRLAGLPRGEVQRDPARGRPGQRRDRHGPGQPGRLVPAGGHQGGGPGGRARQAPATPSSRSPTGWRSWPRPASGRSPSPAARSGTTRSSRPRRRPASRCTSPASGTSTTDAPAGAVAAGAG